MKLYNKLIHVCTIIFHIISEFESFFDEKNIEQYVKCIMNAKDK